MNNSGGSSAAVLPPVTTNEVNVDASAAQPLQENNQQEQVQQPNKLDFFLHTTKKWLKKGIPKEEVVPATR